MFCSIHPWLRWLSAWLVQQLHHSSLRLFKPDFQIRWRWRYRLTCHNQDWTKPFTGLKLLWALGQIPFLQTIQTRKLKGCKLLKWLIYSSYSHLFPFLIHYQYSQKICSASFYICSFNVTEILECDCDLIKFCITVQTSDHLLLQNLQIVV